MRTSTKITAVVGGAALTLATAGAAYAYWTTTGNGSGTASTGTSSAFAVTTSSSVGSPLTPAGPTQTVAFHIKNNNSGVQYATAAAVSVANSDGTPWTSVAGCSAADYTVSVTTFVAGSILSGATKDGVVSISMNDTGSNQDGCKSATVPLYISVT